MKLIFKSEYKSIKGLEAPELKDFTVLTGLNGSGKTHLLKAINDGKIEIEGISKEEIFYYNYNDFIVKKNVDFIYRSNYIEKIFNERYEIISTLLAKYINSFKKRENIRETVHSYLHRNKYFKIEFDRKEFDKMIAICKEEGINNLSEKYENNYYNKYIKFLNIYIKTYSGTIEELNFNKFQKEYNEIKDFLFNAIENKKYSDIIIDTEFYKVFKNILKEKNILNIEKKDYESYYFSLLDIENEEKEYQINKYQNIINNTLYPDFDNNNSPATDKSPVDTIKGILNDYDRTGYEVTLVKENFNWGVDKEKMYVNLKLKPKDQEKNHTIDFDDLSSGEKTLMALSMLIYKARKENIIPRIFLLDEVDSSLHPEMIEHFLSVLKEQFIIKKEMKIILVTHSPTTIAYSDDNSIFVIKNDDDNKHIIEAKSKSDAIQYSTNGFISFSEKDRTLDIMSNIDNSENAVLFTEGPTDKNMSFTVINLFGADNIRTIFNNANDNTEGIFKLYENKIFIGLYDFDKKGYDNWNAKSGKKNKNIIDEDVYKCLTINFDNRGYYILLPVPENEDAKKLVLKSKDEINKNNLMLTIEFLLFGNEVLKNNFDKEEIFKDVYALKFIGDKAKFAQKVKSNKDQIDFSAFIPLFDKIKGVCKILCNLNSFIMS